MDANDAKTIVDDSTKPSIPSALGVSPSDDNIIQVRGLRRWYDVSGGALGFGGKSILKAVDDISFDVGRGKTFGLVGESGCGKTTALRMVLGLETPSEGVVYFEGEDISRLSAAGKRDFRSSVQAVFQDPWSSLNPRMRVGSIIAEPLEIAGSLSRAAIKTRVGDLLTKVGLDPQHAMLFPHEFSGGQRQRIGIARALALNPKVIVLDEPVSALDVSTSAQVMNLLVDLQKEHSLSYLLVAHNLSTVRYMCHRIAVMYLGVIQEIGDTKAIFDRPLHLYTKALLSAALAAHPDAQREETILPGEVVSPINPPAGDVFMSRTPLPVDREHRWAKERPPLVEKEPEHWVVETPWSLVS